MKMIAIGTVHGRKLIKERDKNDPRSRDKYQDLIARPGQEFDTKDFGIGDDEAKSLIATKAAKRKTREIADDGAPSGAISTSGGGKEAASGGAGGGKDASGAKTS